MKIFQENPPANNQPATLIIGRDGQIQELKIEAVQCCKYLVVVVPEDQINALLMGKIFLLQVD